MTEYVKNNQNIDANIVYVEAMINDLTSFISKRKDDKAIKIYKAIEEFLIYILDSGKKGDAVSQCFMQYLSFLQCSYIDIYNGYIQNKNKREVSLKVQGLKTLFTHYMFFA